MARPEITLKFANIQEFTCSCFSGGGTGEQYLRNTGWRSQQKVTGERNLCMCLAKEHNTMSLTRAQALTARCRGEHTNQEATAPPQLRLKRVATLTIFATKKYKEYSVRCSNRYHEVHIPYIPPHFNTTSVTEYQVTVNL